MAPTPRPIRRPVAPAALSKNTLRFFRTGSRLARIFEGKEEQRLREEWDEHQETVLAEWIAEKPFTRPFAWWRWSAPVRRERVDGGLHPHDNPERNARFARDRQQYGHPETWGRSLYYGRPAEWCSLDDSQAEYESDLQYLTRLSLLTPAEIEALTEESAQ